MNRVSTVRIVLAFAAVYVIWGSTYLAIRFAVETVPPFVLAGSRALIAGALMYVWARSTGAARPTAAHWRQTVIIGGLLLLGGNGGVSWAEQHVPSGLAALLITTVPFWMVLLEWLRPGGTQPRWQTVLGVVVGIVGVVLLVDSPATGDHGSVQLIGAVVLLGASLSWAAGSIYSRHVKLPDSPMLVTGMEMLGGGTLLLIFATIVGEWSRFDPSGVSTKSLLSVGYLIVFGSLMGFSAYVWLLKVSTPAKVATYAYVNPVVAVALGWALADEPVTGRTMVAAGIIIAAVIVITTTRTAPAPDMKPAVLAAAPEPKPCGAADS